MLTPPLQAALHKQQIQDRLATAASAQRLAQANPRANSMTSMSLLASTLPTPMVSRDWRVTVVTLITSLLPTPSCRSLSGGFASWIIRP